MLDGIGSVEFLEKKEKIISYLKYALIIFLIIPIYLIARHYIVTYRDIEKDVVKLAQKYVKEKSLNIESEDYIPLGALGEVEGAELCSNASGVIVTRKGNKYKYQAYLKCLDYETNLVSNSEKYIILSGDAVTILNYGEIYEEMGYYTEENVEVLQTGEVNSYKPGIYTISYRIIADGEEKQVLTRKVIVTKYDKASTNSGITSSSEPTLTLYGDTIMVLEKGKKFSEPGYKAIDYYDGKVSRKVKITSDGNVKDIGKTIGTYVITYSITNSKNVTTTKTRTVRVVEHKSDIVIDSSIKKETSGFSIVLKITGTGYAHTVLPDNTITDKTSITYKVTKNGVYNFGVYDIQGNLTVREVDVNDVDITGPSGSCIATVSDSQSNIYISASDKSGISAYSFIYDGIATDFDKSFSKNVSKSISEASAQVKDTYGNISTLKCKINKVSGRRTMTNGIMDIPLLLQTNYTTPIKWGNNQTTTVKRSGCGPTSVAMIVAYLTGIADYVKLPQEIFEWLNSLGYYHGTGYGQTALTRAAAKYGVTCKWTNMNEQTMKETLLSGKPIIAFMGKGTFTSGGHYIVLKGVTSGGKIKVNDPFSEARTKKEWDASLILKEKAVTNAFAVCY